MIERQILDQTVRHAVHLEQLKAGEGGVFKAYLKRIDLRIRQHLLLDDLSKLSRTKLEALLRSIDSDLKGVFSDYYDKLAASLAELSIYEAAFEAKSLAAALVTVKTLLPSEMLIERAVRTSPLSVRGPDGGKLLEPFIKDWTVAERKRVVGAIRQGYAEGQTNQQIIRVVRGTRAGKFKDGILATTTRNAEAVVRTAVQHVAITAKMETWSANDDIINGFRWLSTLDGRTSSQCRSLDGVLFKNNEGPRPPLHIRCRSQLLPEVNLGFNKSTRASKDGQVGEDLDYYDWLKQQPVSFQDDTIGATRGKLLRDGGLSASEFAKLNLSRNFKPATLAQMKLKEPDAFARAFD